MVETKLHKTRGGSRLFTDEIAAEIRNRHHNEGLSVGQLRREYCPDKSAMPIRQILEGKTYRDAGGIIGLRKVNRKQVKPKVSTPKRELKLPKSEYANVITMKASGMTQQAIADAYHVDAAYISRILKAHRNG